MNPNTTRITNGAMVPDTSALTVEDRRLDAEALKSVYISLRFGVFGNSAQADAGEITTDADIECLNVTKRLLINERGGPAAELAAITSGDNALKKWLMKRAFRSLFRAGTYRAPYALTRSIRDEFIRYKKVRDTELVPALVEAYPTIIERAEGKLKRQFRNADYMNAEELAACFKMDWYFYRLDTPMALAAISLDMLNEERSKMAELAMDEVNMMQQALRLEMKQLTDHMVERLSGVDDKGRPKIFKDTMLGNIREFFALFEARNLTDDSRLKELVDKAKGLLAGVNTDSLRDSSATRQQIRSNFSAIQLALDGMVTAKPSRSITFED